MNFVKWKLFILIQISLQFVIFGQIDNRLALVRLDTDNIPQKNKNRNADICFKKLLNFRYPKIIPDSKVRGANMGPTWVLSGPGGPQVSLMNLAIWNRTWK